MSFCDILQAQEDAEKLVEALRRGNSRTFVVSKVPCDCRECLNGRTRVSKKTYAPALPKGPFAQLVKGK